jgi:hypothetical protein
MNTSVRTAGIIYTGWCGLGLIRGINSYNYTFDKYNIREHKLYTDKILHGFGGMFIYAVPIFLPILIYKEIYRLEVDIRDLKDEKRTTTYNHLLL